MGGELHCVARALQPGCSEWKELAWNFRIHGRKWILVEEEMGDILLWCVM